MCSGNGNGSWTPEEIDTLIGLVQERPDIYDQSRPGYSNLTVTDKCWSEISRHLPSKTEQQLKSKWQILRGGYRQRRKDNCAPSGSGTTPYKKWVYFDSLKFLEPYICERTTSSNTPSVGEYLENGNVEVEQSSQDFGDDSVDETLSNTSAASPGSETQQRTRRTSKRQLDEVDRSLCNYLNKKATQKKVRSSVQCFLESLEEDMMELSPQNLRTFKVEVLNLLNAKLQSN